MRDRRRWSRSTRPRRLARSYKTVQSRRVVTPIAETLSGAPSQACGVARGARSTPRCPEDDADERGDHEPEVGHDVRSAYAGAEGGNPALGEHPHERGHVRGGDGARRFRGERQKRTDSADDVAARGRGG